MGKLTLEDLKKLREEKKQALDRRDSEGKDVEIIVGMGTCGIAAGAKDALSAFVEEIEEHGLTNVAIKQTGCMGLCYSEPTVEVRVPGMPAVIYGDVDGRIARKIVNNHIIHKRLVSNHIYDRPAADIIKQGGK